MRLAIYYPDQKGQPQTLTIDHESIRIGRGPECELVIDGARFPKVSGLHAELVQRGMRLVLVHHSKSNPTLLAGKPIEGSVDLKVGDRFRLGHTGPAIAVVDQVDSTDRTVFAKKSSDFLTPPAVTGERIELKKGGVLGREAGAAFHLDHSHVSRRHALITRTGGSDYLSDLGSANGTFLNGKRLSKRRKLAAGDVIDIGPFTLVYDGESLTRRSRQNNISLETRSLHYVVENKSTNGSLHLLNGVSLSIEPGEFVSIIGPSGSGKSTLLRVISGRQAPTSGEVAINGQDLHERFHALKEDIVVVPQSTEFHDVLSVRRVLGYAASLRLPTDTDQQERERIVTDSLLRVGLHEREQTQVRNLSGGQQKRLALANELISDPSLVFLDEVTSGLDEKADKEIMRLLRTLSDAGKTIVCVTHNLGNIEACCHKVLVLTVGGHTAFFGKPSEACKYFGVATLGDIYGVLATRTPEQWSSRYLRSLGGKRLAEAAAPQPNSDAGQVSVLHRLGLRPAHQAAVLSRRYVEVWMNDLPALAATFGQAALVGALLCIVFYSIPDGEGPEQLASRRVELRNLLFLVGVSCFWLGANNAAKELVKERTIYLRERNFNLLPESYWLSKAAVLSVISLLQSTTLVAGVVLFCGAPGELSGYLGAGALLALVGTMLGLMISAFSKTEELSAAMVPVVIIPQIILAGVVSQLNDTALFLAKAFTASYWGQQLLEGILPAGDRMTAEIEVGAAHAVAVLLGQLAFVSVVGMLRVRSSR